MGEFENKFGKEAEATIEQAGVNTEIFQKNARKRLKIMGFIALFNVAAALLNLVAIHNSWLPYGNTSEGLAKFTLLLSYVLIMVWLLGLFVVWHHYYTLNKLSEIADKYKKDGNNIS